MMIAPSLLELLQEHALQLDASGEWPTLQWQALNSTTISGWGIPAEAGGCPLTSLELLRGYEQLARACLTTTFILTQRNAACQRIVDSSNDALKQSLLPELARGQLFATVGISHLTTSRQHWKTPSVGAEFAENEIRLHGQIPWVTGAAHADFIVTGGTCADGRQVLVALPTDATGVVVHPWTRLMALTSSHTALVELQNVKIPASFLLSGPAPEVMKQGPGSGTGSQVTSILALGLAGRVITALQEQARLRPDLTEVADRFEQELRQLYLQIEQSVASGSATENPPKTPVLTAMELRQRANSLALRSTQAGMAVSKGAGFVHGHPAELAVREAMFFLVWSCPQPVVQGVLQELSCQGTD